MVDSNDRSGAIALARRTYGIISGYIPRCKVGLRMYRQRVNGSPGYSSADAIADLRTLIGKMEAYEAEKENELNLARIEAAKRGATIILDNVGNSSATSSSTSSVDFTATIRAVDKSSLDAKEIESLKAAIADLATSGKDPGKVCESASRVLDLAKKAADAARSVAPFVASALSALGI